MNNSIIKMDASYKVWLKGIKQSFAQAQLKAAVSLIHRYWNFIGSLAARLLKSKKTANGGDGFCQDSMAEFPEVKGFSTRNLWAIRQWYLFYSEDFAIVQQPVAQLTQIPWGHNLVIISKCKTPAEAFYYVQNTKT